MTYEEAIQFLFEQLPMFQRVGPVAYKKDLTNTRLLCEALGNPQLQFKTVHIAGTNGKGSVSNMLASVCIKAGLKTGLYTSPHLLDFRERIRIQGELCEAAFVSSFVSKHREIIQTIQPSFFEITVAMAFDYFATNHVDIAIIETGLGGRLDSTNVVEPVLSVITNIGWDHMNLLGNSLSEIASEKAGIIKAHVPVVIGEKIVESAPVFEKFSKMHNAPLFFADEISMEILHNDHHGLSVVLDGNQIHCDLFGRYQEKNLKTTWVALQQLRNVLPISIEDIQEGLSSVKSTTHFRGRLDILQQQPLVLADCAHNLNGMEAILDEIKRIPFRQLHIVFGTVTDKDPLPVLELLPKDATYIFTKADIPRGMDAFQLLEVAKGIGLEGVGQNQVADSVRYTMQKAEKNDLILICGSIFVVAEALKFFDKNRVE